MKNIILASLAVFISACTASQPEQIDINSPTAVTSYSFGAKTADSIQKGLSDHYIDEDLFMLGFQDVMKGLPTKLNLTEDQITEAHQAHNEWATAKKEEDTAIRNSLNAERGLAFQEKYTQEGEAHALEEGIIYKVLSSNESNEIPTLEDTVQVHYEGRLIDGTVFDSSIERGEPISTTLDRVIPGWQIAITHMQKGDMWEVVIPSELAYGERGAAPAIEPNTTLIFKIELIDII